MSGIVGIVNLDGAPVDRRLLERMTDFIAYRGPDAQATWIDGHVGFGHTMLRTTWEAETERQPLSFDGQVWLTADARIDGRADLIAALEGRGRRDVKHANDAELILHAYHSWGEDCVDHLIGDFAFGIWDGRERRLFCARDHFGVKPFYYACREAAFVFGNTLNCLRLHPVVTDNLNEVAIGDFLLFGENQDGLVTSFRDVFRLGAAHRLTVATGGSRQSALPPRRYWSLPTDFHLHYELRNPSDVVEGFRRVFSEAVRDRLRVNRAAIEMSGGLDSTSVAATVRDLISGGAENLRAFCVSYAQLIPDPEKTYADVAAAALGIAIEHVIADEFPLFETEPQKPPSPDPVHVGPLSTPWMTMARRMSSYSRVELTGWDGDTILSEEPRHYFRSLLVGGSVRRLAASVMSYVASQRRLPPVGLRTTVKKLLGRSRKRSRYPRWLDGSFERRAAVRERWGTMNAGRPKTHPTRPYAFRLLSMPNLGRLFETYDPGLTALPMEARHPMLDIRLVDFALRSPPVPWCVSKEILRRAMCGRLPAEIRLRPKSGLPGDPAVAMARQNRVGIVDTFRPSRELERFVNRAAIPLVSGERDPVEVWMNVRPYALDLWFSQLTSTKRSVGGEP